MLSGNPFAPPSPSAEEPPVPAKRLASQLAKTRICKHHARGYCRYADRCAYAHSSDELVQRPNFANTKMCVAFLTGACDKGDNCTYAHGLTELRQKPLQQDDREPSLYSPLGSQAPSWFDEATEVSFPSGHDGRFNTQMPVSRGKAASSSSGFSTAPTALTAPTGVSLNWEGGAVVGRIEGLGLQQAPRGPAEEGAGVFEGGHRELRHRPGHAALPKSVMHPRSPPEPRSSPPPRSRHILPVGPTTAASANAAMQAFAQGRVGRTMYDEVGLQADGYSPGSRSGCGIEPPRGVAPQGDVASQVQDAVARAVKQAAQQVLSEAMPFLRPDEQLQAQERASEVMGSMLPGVQQQMASTDALPKLSEVPLPSNLGMPIPAAAAGFAFPPGIQHEAATESGSDDAPYYAQCWESMVEELTRRRRRRQILEGSYLLKASRKGVDEQARHVVSFVLHNTEGWESLFPDLQLAYGPPPHRLADRQRVERPAESSWDRTPPSQGARARQRAPAQQHTADLGTPLQQDRRKSLAQAQQRRSRPQALDHGDIHIPSGLPFALSGFTFGNIESL